MKKLKLKLDGIKEMLTKEQMKKISGGYDQHCYHCEIVYSLGCSDEGESGYDCCESDYGVCLDLATQFCNGCCNSISCC
ncbi:MAG: hypothetical protein JWQ79_1871 [Mucilaginibacter sp.]|nr:hypothetical protein [Mucilaginibacter sp.]